jgi:hypothetical protein
VANFVFLSIYLRLEHVKKAVGPGAADSENFLSSCCEPLWATDGDSKGEKIDSVT